jgi:prepilin-type N-terminal cleavage/methylation domain-containing protein
MLKLMKRLKGKKGFTLIELIVVIAILGILAAVITPTVLNFVNDARDARDEANASGLFNAAQLAYVTLAQDGNAPATGDYDSEDGSDIIQAIESTLPGSEDLIYTVQVGANGVEYIELTTDGSEIIRHPAVSTTTTTT